MRWFMLPVSAAAHVAVFLGTVIVPLATGVEAPTPLMTVTFRFSFGDPPALVAENSDRPAPAGSRRSAADSTGADPDREL